MLVGLNGDTPLGYVVNVRSETDSEKIKAMTKQKKRIRREWASFKAKNTSKNQNSITMSIEQLQQALRNLAGGG